MQLIGQGEGISENPNGVERESLDIMEARHVDRAPLSHNPLLNLDFWRRVA